MRILADTAAVGDFFEDGLIADVRPNRKRNYIIRLRNRGFLVKDIAAKVGLSMRGVEFHLAKAREAGLLRDYTDAMQTFAVPKAMDIFMEALDGGDKQIAAKVLAGTGVLKSHNKSENNNQSAMSLTIHIDQPTDRDTQDVAAILGEVVGEPRQLGPAK